MKLSEIKGPDSLDVLADIIDPACEILTDKEVREAVEKGGKGVKTIKLVLKNHKKAVIEIMAALERKDPEQYAKNMNILTLPFKVLEIFNDPMLMELFTSQAQMGDATSSGPASESTEEN